MAGEQDAIFHAFELGTQQDLDAFEWIMANLPPQGELSNKIVGSFISGLTEERENRNYPLIEQVVDTWRYYDETDMRTAAFEDQDESLVKILSLYAPWKDIEQLFADLSESQDDLEYQEIIDYLKELLRH